MRSKTIRLSIIFILFIMAGTQDNSINNFPDHIQHAIDVYMSHHSREGEFVLDTTFLKQTPGISEQRSPSVAFNGTQYLVVYTDYSFFPPAVCAMRVLPDGTILDTIGIRISFSSCPQQSPVVACDGTNFLVLWSNYRPSFLDMILLIR